MPLVAGINVNGGRVAASLCISVGIWFILEGESILRGEARMSYEIIIQSEAILEIQEAFEWYEEQVLKKLKAVT